MDIFGSIWNNWFTNMDGLREIIKNSQATTNSLAGLKVLKEIKDFFIIKCKY